MDTLAPHPTADPLQDLVRQAWALHYRRPAELVPLGLRIVEQAGEGTVGAAWGWLQRAWGQRFLSQPEDAAHAHRHAQRLFEQHHDAAGLAACRDLQAMVWGLARRWDEALALLAQNDTSATSARGPYERAQTHDRRCWILNVLGRRDEALRERYAQLAAARQTGDEACLAQGLGLLGGLHADLYNLDEAEQLCAQGMELAERSGAEQSWQISALNRVNALLGLGRAAEGLPIVQALQAREPRLNQRGREQRSILYADVHTAAGLLPQAQALLDESVALRHPGSESLMSWTVAQLLAWQAQGRLQQARELGERWLADPRHGTDPSTAPAEELRLLHTLSAVCEALGDPAAALKHQRRAFAVHEALVGRSARARRLVLEIEHDLDRERWQREQAQAQQRSAEAEGQRLDTLNRALEAANLAKTRFLAAASHDLRQPVQALAMYMAALQREALAPVQAQLVDRMAQTLAALAAMFEVLLDISRLDAGVVAVAPQELSLRQLLHRLADEARPVAAARGLQLRLRLPRGGALLPTRSDPVLLERCLRNLLDNAIKYSQHGGVLLGLRRRGGQWCVLVADTGIGMTAEVQARAYDEFFQADNPERDRSRGLGLGLAIVNRLARLLQHPLQLRSTPGRGSVLSLGLPLLEEQALLPAAAAPVLDGPALAAPEGLCVAVLDDDADVRDSLRAVLERWGHQVLCGATEAALLRNWQVAGTPAVQALVCDLRLPQGRDGVQAVAALRQVWGARLPALVITGDVAPERLHRLRDSGLPALSKPVMPMRLRSWLAGLVPAGQAGDT